MGGSNAAAARLWARLFADEVSKCAEEDAELTFKGRRRGRPSLAVFPGPGPTARPSKGRREGPRNGQGRFSCLSSWLLARLDPTLC